MKLTKQILSAVLICLTLSSGCQFVSKTESTSAIPQIPTDLPKSEQIKIAHKIATQNMQRITDMLDVSPNWSNGSASENGINGQQRFAYVKRYVTRRNRYSRQTYQVPIVGYRWEKVSYPWRRLSDLSYRDTTDALIGGGLVDGHFLFESSLTEPAEDHGFSVQFNRRKETNKLDKAIKAVLSARKVLGVRQ